MPNKSSRILRDYTITRTVHDARNLPLSIWVGTNNTGATDTDPTGGGAPGNNMVAVTIKIYDGGASGGDGNLTLQTSPVDENAANNRNTAFGYDWRNRQLRITAAQDWYQINTLDNLDRAIQIQQYSQESSNLIRQSATNYDNRGRVYQNHRYVVGDPFGRKTFLEASAMVGAAAEFVLLAAVAGARRVAVDC